MKKHQFPILFITLITALKTAAPQCPVPLYKSLNQSHSRSWVQQTDDGNLGLVFFQEGKPGRLIYRWQNQESQWNQEVIAQGSDLGVSVLLFDARKRPHVFCGISSEAKQEIVHHVRTGTGRWTEAERINISDSDTQHIYELSAALGPDGRHHLLVLKTMVNPDSRQYFTAYRNASLVYLEQEGDEWRHVLIKRYDTLFTQDEYVKMLTRQDLAIDTAGKAHIIFGEQLNGMTRYATDRLIYVSNASGAWRTETASGPRGSGRSSAGWFASLALDSGDVPHIAYAYIDRVTTGSAMQATLCYATREAPDNWKHENIVSNDDGYYGGDGRSYTGGLPHLKFDSENRPHILFTDIASSHSRHNYLNLGNIRYAVKKDDAWKLTTLYRQALPHGFADATEITGLCLFLNEQGQSADVIAQEMTITGTGQYICEIIDMKADGVQTAIQRAEHQRPGQFRLGKAYPNPFNPQTRIPFELAQSADTELRFYNNLGQLVQTAQTGILPAGHHEYLWHPAGSEDEPFPSGIYICTLRAGSHSDAIKLSMIR